MPKLVRPEEHRKNCAGINIMATGSSPNSCYRLIATYITLLLVSGLPHISRANDNLWHELKQGGKVALMRHAPVNTGSGNPLLRDPSCKHERNLSDQGKRNAEFLGLQFKQHNIPVSKVRHSPFCRTKDTAHIAFGKASPADYLSLIEIMEQNEAMQQTELLNQVISAYTGEGNLVLVTHQPNINAVSFELLNHLDILVLNPDGTGAFEELGVIKFSELK